MSSISANKDRLPGYDALRMIMMIMGVFFHACYAYASGYKGCVNDEASSRVFDVILIIMHAFRMPVFFAMAGFFAHMVVAKKGVDAWILDRTRRILFPFLFSYFLIVPLLNWMIGIIGDNSEPISWGHAFALISSLRTSLYHFWFLYFLFLQAMIYFLAVKFAPTVFGRIDVSVCRLVGRYAASPALLILIGILVTTLLMARDWAGFVPYSPGLLPIIRVFIYYLFFFYVGTIMHQMHLPLQAAYGIWRWLLTLAVPLSALHVTFSLSPVVDGTAIPAILANLVGAALSWTVLFGSVGACHHFFRRDSTVIRNWANAGYWIYLLHFPVILLLTAWFKGMDLPVAMKFLMVTGISILVGYLSYIHLVQGKAIGRFLFGKHPKGTPRSPVQPNLQLS